MLLGQRKSRFCFTQSSRRGIRESSRVYVLQLSQAVSEGKVMGTNGVLD